jgi:fermentation-respiration switch protein FrsA (DUF1100 family)
VSAAPETGSAATPRRSWRGFTLRLIKIACCAYVGVIVLLMVLENWLLFHPVSAAEEWWAPPSWRVEDVQLRTANGTAIHAWWCPVEGWQPAQGAMLYCHGNAGNLSMRAEPIAQWQEELHQSVLIFDYPGYGRSEGKPTESACYAAADAAHDWLTQVKRMPAESIVIYGSSLGGAVAVDLASRRPHRALVLVSTFLSMPDMAQSVYPWLPARWLVRSRFDSAAKIGRCTQPVFIAHGTADSLVPFSQGRRLFETANEPRKFLALEGFGHLEAFSAEFFPTLRAFLAEHAKLPGP